MDLEELTQKAVHSIDYSTLPLDYGEDGVIYIVDKNVVLKLHKGIRNSRVPYFYHGSSKASAEHEYSVGKELYEKGIQVPQFFGIFKADKPPLDYWGIFMERIRGVTYKVLPPLIRKEAKRQFREQKKEIKKVGYLLEDTALNHNVLFDLDKNKLYFYDFVRWERK